MKIVAGMATTNERMKYAEIAIQSIINQVDSFHLYNNSVDSNKADNGKYFGLALNQYEPVYYFTLDDDIIYPPNYVQTMIDAIEKYQCIVSCHGRILTGTNREYYTDHKAFCFASKTELKVLDVFGDGVSAYRTDYFNPYKMAFDKRLMMADTLVSLEAARLNKTAILLPHEARWIRSIKVPSHLTISGTRHDRRELKNKLADDIFTIKRKFT